MSKSPCYPEDYDWGSPIIPHSRRGYYRSLYQAFDAAGLPRIYPATYIQCINRIIRGDNWQPLDFAYAMLTMQGNGWATQHGLIDATAPDWSTAAVNMVVRTPGLTPDAWWWTNGYDEAADPPIVAILGHYGPPFTFYSLRDPGVSWVYSAPAPLRGGPVSYTQYAVGPFLTGAAPWLNPL